MALLHSIEVADLFNQHVAEDDEGCNLTHSLIYKEERRPDPCPTVKPDIVLDPGCTSSEKENDLDYDGLHDDLCSHRRVKVGLPDQSQHLDGVVAGVTTQDEC